MPSIAITRPYEAVYILDPDLGDEQITAVTNRYKGLVESNGGQVQKIDVWERRKLAYEVKGRNEGIYVIMQFTGQANVEAELRRVFQISEDQIRSMIVRLDEENPQAAPTAQAAPAAQAVPAPAAETVAVQPASAPEATAAPEETAVPEAAALAA